MKVQLVRRLGFSLVELLVVIVVIVLLAGLVMSLSGTSTTNAATSKTKNHLKLLEMKLQDYTAAAGQVPAFRDESGLVVYEMLFGDGVGRDGLAGTKDDEDADCVPDAGARVFPTELDPHLNSLEMVAQTSDGRPGKLIDAFGNPWRYQAGAGANNPDFDLWSAGPDRKYDTADDIRNW
ncbi:MAG: prepilin-type N-terminal cleavage/methylation domain-containing protein [Roseibacillus sp.]